MHQIVVRGQEWGLLSQPGASPIQAQPLAGWCANKRVALCLFAHVKQGS